MKTADVTREIAYPLTNVSVLVALGVFFLLAETVYTLIGAGPVFLASAMILAAFAGPALLLYLLHLLEARARGVEAAPPTIDHFHWYGGFWALSQLLYVVIVVGLGLWAADAFGVAGAAAVNIVFALLLPASAATLALTRSPLESMNPRTIYRIVRRCAADYWIAPAFVVAAEALLWWLATLQVPPRLLHLAAMLLLFSAYTLTGGVFRSYRLHDEVDIHAPTEPDAAATDANTLRTRNGTLGHAYGFFSRDNRTGGLRHLQAAVEADPDPAAARRWYLEQMLGWENRMPALLYGQQYLAWLLQNGDDVAAVKLILRCRLEDESFLPLPQDRERAAAAAERCQQLDLAARLQ